MNLKDEELGLVVIISIWISHYHNLFVFIGFQLYHKIYHIKIPIFKIQKFKAEIN